MIKEELEKVKLVFISHYHVDHHTGLLEFCNMR